MNPGTRAKFLSALGSYTKPTKDEWQDVRCPLAAYKHNGGVDNNPSFGVSRNDTGESICKCWSCGFKGSPETLLFELIGLSKLQLIANLVDFKAAWGALAQEPDTPVISLPEPVNYSSEGGGDSHVIFSEEWLQSFVKCYDHPYLKERGVSKKIAARLDIRYDNFRGMVCYPIRDCLGNLIGLQGRSAIGSNCRFRLYDWQGQRNNQVVGNLNNIRFEKPVVLVEGWFDMASVLRVYDNVIPTFTSSISQAKLELLEDAEIIISMYDYGTGGDNAREILGDWCAGERSLHHILPTVEEGDPGNMTQNSIVYNLRKYLPMEV